jgi:hypothetical protein
MSSRDTIGRRLSDAAWEFATTEEHHTSGLRMTAAQHEGAGYGNAFRAAELAHDLAWEQATTRATDIVAGYR